VGVPSGTVTFLFTDIEGSTRLWQQDEALMQAAVARHDELLRSAVADHGGTVFSGMGDGIAAAFGAASAAVRASLAAQELIASETWPTATPLRVRMGLHTGEAEERDGDYFGTAVNRAARLMAVAHGGQVVCSSATAGVVDAEVVLMDLGEHRLRDLDRPMRVFQVGGGSFGELRSLDAFPGNLPLQVTSFIGRDAEVAAVSDLLVQSRLVTLTGVGGVGKTRLALQAAAEALPRYRDGAWLVELGPVRDGAQVVDAVTGAFSLTVAPGVPPADGLVEFLRTKQLVLVVDNCEHLIGAAAAVISKVIGSCAGVAVLATSREGLALAGERMIAVPSLGAPSPEEGLAAVAGSGAVRLFVDRAVAVDAGFVLSSSNAAAVAEVCRRLDGIPLAIELAAARLAMMSPAELATRLDRRFRVLAGGRRGAVERHQTLRAAIDWSYELLTVPQQVLLARLSVFAGGCTLGAAEAVCAGGPIDSDDVFDLLGDLVARSLVLADHDAPVTRYRLLETIRQYGEDHLAAEESEALQARHAEHFARLAEDYFRHLFGPDEQEWALWVAADGENLTAAMNWALDTDNADIGLRIGANLTVWAQVDFAAPTSVVPALTLRGAVDHPLYPMALARAANDAAGAADRRTVEERCAQSLDAERRRGDPSGGLVGAWVCQAEGLLESGYGLWRAAADHGQRGAGLALAAGHAAMASGLLGAAAVSLVASGDEAGAIDAATRALTLARQSAGARTINQAVTSLAMAVADTDPARARALLTEAFETMEEVGYAQAGLMLSGANVAARLGDWRLTLRLTRRAIPEAHWMGAPVLLQGAFIYDAAALADTRPDAAARLQGAARSIRRTTAANQGTPDKGTPPVSAPARGGMVTGLHRDATRRLANTLTEDHVTRLRREGEEMDVDHAVAYALAEIDAALADPTIDER
jgi:predicted ATPase/class 3 adenylate cyclase